MNLKSSKSLAEHGHVAVSPKSQEFDPCSLLCLPFISGANGNTSTLLFIGEIRERNR